MSPEPSPRGRLRFGSFLLDPRTGELTKGGMPLRLSPQPARVLSLLASRAGDLVTREELRREVWDSTIHLDFNQAINFCIRQIRRALGDSAAAPRYIETLARRGYRFLPAVREEAGAAGAAAGRDAAVVSATAAGATVAGPTTANGDRVMLVVLPFENLSGDPGQEYLGDGLTEEMIATLGRLDPRRLGVIARTSSMRYKVSPRGVSEIARELGVRYLLEGSVRVSDGRVRITAQLIQAADQTHLWSETYERPLRDVLVLQAEVARRIARAIRLTLDPDRTTRLDKAPAVVPDAYQAYLRGLVHLAQSSREACAAARDSLEQALRADPGFAPAHAALSLIWSRMGFHGLLVPREAERRARDSARRAIEIDPECADGHAALGRVALEFEWDLEAGERACLQALAINPNHVTAHHWLAHLHLAAGRQDAAADTSLRAIELDPFDPGIHAHLAWHWIQVRRYDEAIARARRTLDLDRNSMSGRIHLGWALLQKGRRREAFAELSEAASPGRGENNEALWCLGHACAVTGRRRRARAILNDLSRRGCRASFGRALIHAGLGEADEAFRCLDAALDERCVQMIYLRDDPRFDPLRSDPRFEKLVRRVGLPAGGQRIDRRVSRAMFAPQSTITTCRPR